MNESDRLQRKMHELDRVNAILAAYGFSYPDGARGVADLARYYAVNQDDLHRRDPDNYAAAIWPKGNSCGDPACRMCRTPQTAAEPADEQDYPGWQPLAVDTRQALILLRYGVPECLPGEPGACGGNFAEHTLANLGALRAVVEHHIRHLGADAMPLIEQIYARTRDQLAAEPPCGQKH